MRELAATLHAAEETIDGGTAPFDHPYCFDCGYDLQGLDLPRPCPECGRTCDPATEIPQLRAWFASRWTAITWLFRRGPAPTGVWTALYDQRSLKIAKRRERFWLWLPALLTLLTVGVGAFVAIDYDVKLWYYNEDDPLRTHWCEKRVEETDRLYTFNFDARFDIWDLLFLPKNGRWVQGVERQRTGYRFSMPDTVDSFNLLWGGYPAVIVVFCWLPVRFQVTLAAKRVAITRGRPALPRAGRAAWSLTAVPVGIALWLWLWATWLYGLSYLISETFTDVYVWINLSSAALWLLGLPIAAVRLIKRDKARLVFANRLQACAAVVLVMGGPVWITLYLLR